MVCSKLLYLNSIFAFESLGKSCNVMYGVCVINRDGGLWENVSICPQWGTLSPKLNLCPQNEHHLASIGFHLADVLTFADEMLSWSICIASAEVPNIRGASLDLLRLTDQNLPDSFLWVVNGAMASWSFTWFSIFSLIFTLTNPLMHYVHVPKCSHNPWNFVPKVLPESHLWWSKDNLAVKRSRIVSWHLPGIIQVQLGFQWVPFEVLNIGECCWIGIRLHQKQTSGSLKIVGTCSMVIHAW